MDKILREHPNIDPDLADEESAKRYAALWKSEVQAHEQQFDKPINAISINHYGTVFVHSGMFPFQNRKDTEVGILTPEKAIPDDLAKLIRETRVVLYIDHSHKDYLEGQFAGH